MSKEAEQKQAPKTAATAPHSAPKAPPPPPKPFYKLGEGSDK